MTEVADRTLLLFSTFAHMQWQVDELATRCTGVDDAVRAAFEETGRADPDQIVRSWERRNQQLLHQMRRNAWFNLESWHALVLASRLTDQTRPLFFEFYSERELGADGRHAEFVATYAQVKRLRDFLAHNMAMKALPDDERLSVTWFHDTDMGRWMDEDRTRLNLTFMTEAVEVVDWLLDVAVWTFWKLGWNGNAEIKGSKGIEFSDAYAPSVAPPHDLGVPATGSEDQ
jgi:hypothetical protein